MLKMASQKISACERVLPSFSEAMMASRVADDRVSSISIKGFD